MHGDKVAEMDETYRGVWGRRYFIEVRPFRIQYMHNTSVRSCNPFFAFPISHIFQLCCIFQIWDWIYIFWTLSFSEIQEAMWAIPGWRLRDVQHWWALIQICFNFDSTLFIAWKSLKQSWSALNFSVLNSADFLWIGAVQNWLISGTSFRDVLASMHLGNV